MDNKYLENRLFNLLGYNPKINSFNQAFNKYRNTIAKKNFATEEAFSWQFDTSLSDLRKCVFVDIPKEDLVNIQNDKFIKILEICE